MQEVKNMRSTEKDSDDGAVIKLDHFLYYAVKGGYRKSLPVAASGEMRPRLMVNIAMPKDPVDNKRVIFFPCLPPSDEKAYIFRDLGNVHNKVSLSVLYRSENVVDEYGSSGIYINHTVFIPKDLLKSGRLSLLKIAEKMIEFDSNFSFPIDVDAKEVLSIPPLEVKYENNNSFEYKKLKNIVFKPFLRRLGVHFNLYQEPVAVYYRDSKDIERFKLSVYIAGLFDFKLGIKNLSFATCYPQNDTILGAHNRFVNMLVLREYPIFSSSIRSNWAIISVDTQRDVPIPKSISKDIQDKLKTTLDEIEQIYISDTYPTISTASIHNETKAREISLKGEKEELEKPSSKLKVMSGGTTSDITAPKPSLTEQPLEDMLKIKLFSLINDKKFVVKIKNNDSLPYTDAYLQFLGRREYIGTISVGENMIEYPITVTDAKSMDILLEFVRGSKKYSVKKTVSVNYFGGKPNIEGIKRYISSKWSDYEKYMNAIANSRSHDLIIPQSADRVIPLGRILDSSCFMEEYKIPVRPGYNYFITGRTGSGKSYTLGTILEGLAFKDIPGVSYKSKVVPAVVIDVLNVFRDSIYPNTNPKEEKLLKLWGLLPQSIQDYVKIFYIGKVPDLLKDDIKKYNMVPLKFSLDELEDDDWVNLLDISNSIPQTTALFEIINRIKKRNDRLTFDNLYAELDIYEGHSETVGALRRRIQFLESWNICDAQGTDLKDIIRRDQISIISLYMQNVAQQDIVLSMLFRKFQKALTLLRADKLPPFFVLIDELHTFWSGDYPKTAKSMSTFIRICRAAGSGMIMASQRPSDIPKDIVSQTNVIIGHTLDKEEDIFFFKDIVSTNLPYIVYQGENNLLRNLPPGFCVISDPEVGTAFLVAVRPRVSKHGGETPNILEKL